MLEPYEPGLNVWDWFVKLDEDEDGFGPYLDAILISSGVEWLKFLRGGLLVLRPPERGT